MSDSCWMVDFREKSKVACTSFPDKENLGRRTKNKKVKDPFFRRPPALPGVSLPP